MAGESEIPYKEGYLLVPPSGQLKKKWQRKFCQLFSASKQGIDRLEIYENEEDASKTLSVPIVTLEDCIKITQDPQKSQPFLFTVVTKQKIHYFAGSSEKDMLDWISAFQSVAFQDTASRQTIEEDNELYCSSGGDGGVYRVSLVATEASIRCSLTPGDYTLIVSPAALQLRQTRDNALLYTWPYRYIRRYGHKRGRFTFEAGRKCESGEGSFDLEHRSPQDIFRTVCSRMQSMKQLLSSRDNLLGVGDSQFQHALGMTARSRSPLPPSPTSTTPLLPPRKPHRKHPPPQPQSQPPLIKQQEFKEVELRIDTWKIEEKSVEQNVELSSEKVAKVFIHEKCASNYDKLDHFGSTPKLNLDPSYSHVSLNGDWKTPQLVEDHPGYGVIRKKSQTDSAICNDLEYAVICKTHRV